MNENEIQVRIAVPNPDGQSNIFRNLALDILGDTVLEHYVQVIEDENEELIENSIYVVKPHCENMVASVTWSLFLVTTLLVFGLIRSLFNIFGGREK